MKTAYLFLLIILLGCESKEETPQITEMTQEALGSHLKKGVGCQTDKPSLHKNKVCEGVDSSDLILATLKQEEKTMPISHQLDSLLKLAEKSQALENKRDNYIEDLENLVISYNRAQNPISVKEELTQLVEDAQRENLSSGSIKERLSSLVENASKENQPKSVKSVKVNLEELIKRVETSPLEKPKLSSSVAKEDYIIIQVEKGDSLSSLAEKYYSDPSKYNIIYQANLSKIEDGYTIYPDIELKIPKI